MMNGNSSPVPNVEHVVLGGHTLLMPSPSYPPGAAHYEHQRNLGTPMLLPTHPGGEPSNEGAAPPAVTAYRVWPCARHLAEWLHASGDAPAKGNAVLELGAGCGLVGFSAWLAGAAPVCVTDLAENLPRLERLVASNGATAAISVAALDWTQPPPPSLLATDWDVILAADCVFWPHLFEPLLNTIAALASSKKATRVILAMTDRLGRMEAFRDVAASAGWQLQSLRSHTPARPLPQQSLEAMRRETCALFEMMRVCSFK